MAGPPAAGPRPRPSPRARRGTRARASGPRAGPHGRGRGSRSGRAPTPMLPGLPRHLLTGAELTPADLEAILHRAEALKREPHASRALEGRSVALLFEKPST